MLFQSQRVAISIDAIYLIKPTLSRNHSIFQHQKAQTLTTHPPLQPLYLTLSPLIIKAFEAFNGKPIVIGNILNRGGIGKEEIEKTSWSPNKAHLLKMMIKRKNLCNTKFFHNGIRCIKFHLIMLSCRDTDRDLRTHSSESQ